MNIAGNKMIKFICINQKRPNVLISHHEHFKVFNFKLPYIRNYVNCSTIYRNKTYIDNRFNIVHKINAFSEQYYINCLQTAWRWLYWKIKTMSFFFIQTYNLFWYRQIVGFHILDRVRVFFTIPVFFFSQMNRPIQVKPADSENRAGMSTWLVLCACS